MTYRVHGERPVRRMMRFYRATLPKQGWKPAGLGSYRLNYSKGGAYVHVFAYARMVLVSVDHDCCD